jgi:FG-GAP-like repeat/FG-GAP repeat
VNFDTGLFASGVAIGDFNRDGFADMAVTNQNSANVSVLPGDGKGGFGGKTDFAVGGPPQRIATADLDGDGTLDLVLPLQGPDPQSMSVADLNGDGFLDIAISNSLPLATNSTVSVLFGDGKGNFSERLPVEIGVAGRGTGVADFNGDGYPDLVIANNDSNTVSVLLSDGRGHFATRADFKVGTGPRKLTVGDLNGDGRADIVVPNAGSNNVSVLINSCRP